MRTLVLVHGRAQEFKDAVELKAQWVDALHAGLRAAGIDDKVPDERIRFAYYGQTLHDLVSGDPGSAAAVIVRGDGPQEASEAAFVHAVLQEVAEEAGVTDDEVREELDDPAIERGPLNWTWVRGLATVLDRHVPGASMTTVALTTKDVHRYLTNAAVRSVIDDGVRQAMPDDGEAVVVSHSLGTVVAYNLLRRESEAAGWTVPLLVTLGSPLGVTAIRNALRALRPIATPGGVGTWFNAYDPQDIVSLYALDAAHFPVDPAIDNHGGVDNPTSNQHGISGYLGDPTVARRIHEALTA